jgi:thiol-disulfide isomerase/thioredoxin
MDPQFPASRTRSTCTGVPTQGRWAWTAPRWLGVSFVVLALSAAGAVTASSVARRASGEFERARSAVDADELSADAASTFALPARGGGTLDLAQLRGKVLLVTFWATWCPPCRVEEPSLRELARSLSPDSFQLLAISVDDGWDPVDRFFGAANPPYSVLLDRGAVVSRTWGTTRFPESYIVDPSGNLRLKFAGPRDWTDPNVLMLLQRLGAHRALSPVPAVAAD